jgi:biotin synthase-related radical SAM superfamily protein
MLIRASIGTLASLGREKMSMLEHPTTAYLLQYYDKGCSAQCLFCSQSSSNLGNKDFISRVRWPKVELEKLVVDLKKTTAFTRICVQNVVKRDFQNELIRIVKKIKDSGIKTPISVGTTPINSSTLQTLQYLGVDQIGIGLDIASRETFGIIKKPFLWDDFWEFIETCVALFGNGHVYVHLIYGMGQTETEFAMTMERVYKIGAEVALFSFTPLQGTPLEYLSQPEITQYRRIQVIRLMLSKGLKLNEILEGNEIKIDLNKESEELKLAFLASGCPGCNRPFYNERPSKIYNYPSLSMLKAEHQLVQRQLSGQR